MHPIDPVQLIEDECDALKLLLLEKNARYGNSALVPLRIFSHSDVIEQLLVRIDDKLSRIQTRGLSGPDEDTLQDLLGYLILLRVALRLRGTPEPSALPSAGRRH